MKRILPLGILIYALCGLPASAIIDTNNKGMSDLWERHFNNGKLFPETFDPQGDDDADGWSNVQEAAAGTDPFDPNSPNGLMRPEICHIPATYGTPNGNGIPGVITPEAVTVTWPSIVGKQYTLLFSPDLSEESWSPVDASFIGDGNDIIYSFEMSQSDKCFWRVATTDIDSNSDGLTDYEEYLLTVDNDLDGVPDEWERRVSSILFADYGIIAPADPALFDVNANYGGINTSAALVYQGLAGDFDLATTEIVAEPSYEGSRKTIDHYKSGFVGFPQLYAPYQWLETGPVIDYYRKLHSDYHYDYGGEMPLVITVFAWTENHGHCVQNDIYAWDVTHGWQATLEKEAQNYTSETWQWWDDYPSPPVDWYIHDYSSIYLNTYDVGVTGDPPALPNNRVVGEWTTNTPTFRVGSGARHTDGTQAVRPVPIAGYVPRYRKSETFTLSQTLSDPYTTADLIADAGTALEAAAFVSSEPFSYRNLVENESKISLASAKYRLGWYVPANVPIYPGNNQVRAIFLWQEVTDPETSTAGGRMIKWKHELVNATPGTLAQTPWHDLPPPTQDGTSWIRTVSPHASITLPKAILVNIDDDDANGQEDRNQTSLTLETENDLIPLNFEADEPGADETAMVYRLESTGTGKVRLWAAFPNQQPQIVNLPYKLQSRDYKGSVEVRPNYYIEATKPGAMSLKIHAEVLGEKLALVATAEFKCLEISIGFAANMQDVIGGIVPSNIANCKTVHFVTTKSATPTDAVVLTATGISGDEITPQNANQLAEWVGAAPIAGTPLTARILRTSTGKYPVSIRLISTGQTTVATNVWVTWATLSTQSGTPFMMPPQDIFAEAPNQTVVIGCKFSGKLLWRYVCEPTEMFDLTSDVPNFNQAPTVPAPGIHPWTKASLAPGAALRYDASRQTRTVARSNDSDIDLALHDGKPDIMSYPENPIEGNDDPDLGAETFPYLPWGTTAILTDSDYPNIKLSHTTGSSNPNATIFE